jgi:hypothetical protein
VTTAIIIVIVVVIIGFAARQGEEACGGKSGEK